jgi:hypothetical protein
MTLRRVVDSMSLDEKEVTSGAYSGISVWISVLMRATTRSRSANTAWQTKATGSQPAGGLAAQRGASTEAAAAVFCMIPSMFGSNPVDSSGGRHKSVTET